MKRGEMRREEEWKGQMRVGVETTEEKQMDEKRTRQMRRGVDR